MKKRIIYSFIVIISSLIIFNWEKINEINFILRWSSSLNKDKVIITRDFIKPGWLNKDLIKGQLILEEILLDSNVTTNTKLSYKFINENAVKIDSCYVFFGKEDIKLIEFDKEYDWKWKFVCENERFTKEKYGKLKKNTFYRFSNNILGSNIDYVYIYIDKNGQIHQFEAYLNI